MDDIVCFLLFIEQIQSMFVYFLVKSELKSQVLFKVWIHSKLLATEEHDFHSKSANMQTLTLTFLSGGHCK